MIKYQSKHQSRYKFDYQFNLLITPEATYDLDLLRQWLLINEKELCLASKIRTIFRPQTVITDIVFANGVIRREIDMAGTYVNTYDWHCIFFNTVESGLIQNFINENSANRNCGEKAVTR